MVNTVLNSYVKYPEGRSYFGMYLQLITVDSWMNGWAKPTKKWGSSNGVLIKALMCKQQQPILYRWFFFHPPNPPARVRNDRSLPCVRGAGGWVRGGPPTGFRRGAGGGGGGPSTASSPCAGKSLMIYDWETSSSQTSHKVLQLPMKSYMKS